jgi:hypothetical protein
MTSKYWKYKLFEIYETCRVKIFSSKQVSLVVNISVIALVLSILPASVLPTFATPPNSTPNPELITKEIKFLAKSDVNNGIPRRTDFVIKTYTDSQIALKTREIRKIYEEEYLRISDEKFPQSFLKNPLTPIGASILGAFLGGCLLGWFSRRISRLKATEVNVNIPFGIGSLKLNVDSATEKAAWLLYVELKTRIATQVLDSNDGLLREALTSVYKIFEISRQILKDAGPDIGMKDDSVGGIVMNVLNKGLRPFTAKWHPELERWESERPENKSKKAHEEEWTKKDEMHAELGLLRTDLEIYTQQLGEIAKRMSEKSKLC